METCESFSSWFKISEVRNSCHVFFCVLPIPNIVKHGLHVWLLQDQNGMGGTETGDWRGSCQLFIPCGGSLAICNLANSSSASLLLIKYRILAVKYIFTWEVEAAEDKFSSDIYYFCEAHLTQLIWGGSYGCVLSVCVGMREGRGLIVVMAQTIAP